MMTALLLRRQVRPALIFVSSGNLFKFTCTDLLNYLSANQLNTTFFIVGSRAISRPEILQAEYLSGHQVRFAFRHRR